jgi:hypothetical protein
MATESIAKDISASALAMKDRDSRKLIRTATKDDHWDQVLGISQNAINQDFINLHQTRPELRSFKKSGPYGNIEGTLEPVRLMLVPTMEESPTWLYVT